MSKKQRRIAISQIDAVINLEAPLSFVLKNGSVLLAKPTDRIAEVLKVKNTRGRKMELPLSEIAEIWSEEKVISDY